ncbi:hypothetical protein R1sor_012106 [Riccia sorocarpa]|uniref:DUF7869 domain-containing protein n=1 Tax=Riccia sorocarpa TaxID=122646 RepID=A0ABD3I6N6_9MARC
MGQVQPFPLKVVGILNHGHEPGVVAHVSVSGLWPSDPNYTISSIAKQLRDYENYHSGSKTGDLAFREPASHELFSALLDEDVFNTTVLRKVGKTYEEFFSTNEEEASSSTRSDSTTRMLPPNLYIQLDNSGKDNKNWLMMAFCSELVARGCCKTVTMSFLMIGHTHEDVDAFFSKEDYGGRWVPVHGRSMWRRSDPNSDSDFNLVLPPRQDPVAVSPRSPHPKQGEIQGFIRNYIKYKEEMQEKTDPTTEVYSHDKYLVEYWTRISSILTKGWKEVDGGLLKEGFWPVSNHGTGHISHGYSRDEIHVPLAQRQEVEDEIQAREEIFVGQAAERKLANFVPFIDILSGLMLLLRPSEDFCCQDCLWVAKAMGPVARDEGSVNFNKIPIQWWRPKHPSSKAPEVDRYSQCIQREVPWEIDPAYTGTHWIEADACVYAWKSRAKKDKVLLPRSVQEIALSVLEKITQESVTTLAIQET